LHILKIKIMSLFKLGDFLGKLRYEELKKYFPKKHVAQALYLNRTLLIAGINKYIGVRLPTICLPYEPAMALLKKSKIKSEQILGVGIGDGIDKQRFVELQKSINHSLFNFKESVAEIFYLLFNKSVVIRLPKALIIPVIS